jgi:molybdenum cofactor cytidylyltransferase
VNIAAVVLAAGASSRLGQPKQLLRNAHDETLVHAAAREAIEAGATAVVVVVGAHATSVTAAVNDLSVTVAHNKNWSSGLSSSITCGVHAVTEMVGVNGVLLLTCDMPSVGVQHLRNLLDAFTAGAVRVASSYGATVGIPAVIDRADFGALLALSGDKGAKVLLIQRDTTLVALDNGTFDLDTPADVARWREEWSSANDRPTEG